MIALLRESQPIQLRTATLVLTSPHSNVNNHLELFVQQITDQMYRAVNKYKTDVDQELIQLQDNVNCHNLVHLINLT